VSETHGRYSLGKDRTYTRLLVGDVGSKEEVLVSIHTPLFDRKVISDIICISQGEYQKSFVSWF
jgi:hypothetical protein